MIQNFELKLFSGTANQELSEKISEHVGIALGKSKIRRFSDGEIFVEIEENVRGKDVFVIQPTCDPSNENLMELLIIVDALKRASAGRTTAVIPYYGYARQDRKVAPRTPITSKLVADLLEAAGAERILAVDLHAGQIQGFFNIPFDHLYAAPIFLEHLQKTVRHEKLTIVSPDAGGVERARAYAKRMDCELAIVDKRRETPNESEVMNVIGNVKGKSAIIVDDIVDTAGTITNAAVALVEKGAVEVRAVCTHPVLSGKAVARIMESPISEFTVSDSIPLGDKNEKCPKLKVLSVCSLLGEAIQRIHTGDSVSSLFV
jgi:ribose-phosphate pyrophosphokinase